MTGAVLAVDLGTTGVKVALIGDDGRVLAGAAETLATRFGADGTAEQDAEHWWQAIGRCTRQVVAASPAGRSVDLVAVTAQYMSIVAVDRQGVAIAPVVTWMDQRGAAHHPGRTWDDETALDALVTWIDRHGLPTGGADGIGQLSLVRDLWPDVWRDAAAFVQPVDHVLARLTGVVAATQNTAFPLMLTDNRTWGEPAYDPELVERAGFPADELVPRLPPLQLFGMPRGELTPAAAEHLGLPAGITVAAGTIDTTTSTVGVGAVAAGRIGIVIGTTAVVVAHLAGRGHDLEHGIASVASPVPGRFAAIAENGTGGKALDAFVTNIVHAADGLTAPAGASVRDPFGAIAELAATSPAGANGVLFAPWLAGAMAPLFDPAVRAAFLGVGLATTRADLARAVFEGVACNLGRLAPYVAALTGADASPAEPIVFGGGGARSALWGQLLADVTGRPVRRLAEPQYTNARGAAFVAAAEQGRIRWDEIDRLLVVDAEHDPDPRHVTRYGRQIEALTALQDRLAEFHRTHRAALSPDIEDTP